MPTTQAEAATGDGADAEFAREKDAIGRRAADLVDDGAVVILDAGTTTEFVAQNLDATGVTVFTNGVGVINILLLNAEISVVVLGGRLRPMNEMISGAEAEDMLSSVVADYAFIGADAVHPHYGIASRTLEQSRLRNVMTQHAWRIVVVADSRKLCTDKSDYWSPLPARWSLITDDSADPAALDHLRHAGAQIDLIQPQPALNEPASLPVWRGGGASVLRPRLASIGFLDLPAGGCAGIPVLSAPKECQVSAHDDWDDFADLLPLMS